MPVRRQLTLALCAAAVLAAQALAQDTKPPAPPPPAPKPGKDGPRIKMGAPTESGEPAAPEDADAAPAKTEPELWMEDLALWPAAEGKQASIRLAATPAIAWPLLEKKMLEPNQDWRVIAGCAATLGKMRDLRAIDLIRSKLEDRKMYQHSGDLLEALVRIDPVGAKQRLFGLLVHPASAVVAEVEKLLEPRVTPDDADTLRDVYDAGGPAARASAIRLATKADPAGARPQLVKALRDKDPEVAFAAASALASDESPEAVDLLRKSMVTPLDRQFAYATMAMAIRAERHPAREVDDATVRTLLGGRGIKSLDQLSRAAAAMLLADLGYFHDVPLLDESLDKQVAPVLIESIATREFWPDMKVVQQLAVKRLRRLSGRLDLSRPQEWAAWWEQSGSQFTARRVLLEVSADGAPAMVLTLAGGGAPGGESTTLTAAPEFLGPQREGELSLLVEPADAVALAKIVNESGALTAMEAPEGLASEAHAVTIEVRTGKRDRRTAARTGVGDAGVEKLVAAVAELRSRLAWQRYRTGSTPEEAHAFVAATRGAFGPERSEEERSRALASLIIGTIDDRRGEAWNVRCLAELEAMPKLGEALTAAETDRLLAILGNRTSLDAVAQGIVRVLAKSRRAEATPHLLDFLVTRGGAETRNLTTLVLEYAPRAVYLAALSDPRPDVRLAAFAAAKPGETDDEVLSRILKAVDDKDRNIASEAVRALGRLRLEKARPLIDRLAETQSDVRPAAIEALGLLGGRESLATIRTAYASDDPGLRVAALQAFAATREPEGISDIVFAMSNDPSPLVREMAGKAILDLGGDRAAAELRRLAVDPAQPAGARARALAGYSQLAGKSASADLAKLVDDPTPEVADEAALGLARWRDPAAVQRLIKMLESARSVQRARHGLESISLESFGQADPVMLADLYAGWWELSKERGAKRWLLDALTLENTSEDSALRAWAEGDASRQVVPSLLAALKHDKWYIRRAADLALRDLLSKKAGDQEPWSTPADVARMAATWERIWAETLSR